MNWFQILQLRLVPGSSTKSQGGAARGRLGPGERWGEEIRERERQVGEREGDVLLLPAQRLVKRSI